jgi:hypothetical protein
MTFRPPHSPFVFNKAVGEVDYNKLKKMAEECEFGYGEDSAGGTMDVGIENTPHIVVTNVAKSTHSL